jgi:hypothetical protein
MSDRCSSCKAEVVWGITVTGHRMPVNAEPDPAGRWRLFGDTPRIVYVPVERRVELAGQLHVSHFATCPFADQHRKRS